MAVTDGAVDVRLAAPGPWAPRRIAFISTSTYASSPTMEPLNQPVARIDRANGSNGSGNGHLQYQPQQQFARQGQRNVAGSNGRLGRSEPLSLPSNMPLQWAAPQKIGAGLSNLGNTCFLNSVLQCLTYTPPLAGYLQSGQHKAFCRVAGFCAFCALQEHVQQALASSGKVVSPQKLAKNLRSICRSFKMGRQEDSHEYMRYLLDALHKCCLPPDLAEKSNSKPSQDKSLVYKIFGGQLRSQVKCTVCSFCSNTYDPFLDLSLEISRADSLLKALTRFTAVDVLDGDNKYRCLRCKKKVRALKCFTIDLVPNILTIQFKRFAGGQGGKIDKRVDFQTMLDLGPYVSNGQGSSLKYKLFGVLVHSGWSTHSGHYYSFLRASSDIWHVFDDTRVRQVSEQTVLEQKAYMLFYVRDCKKARITDSELHSPAPPQAATQLAARQLSVDPVKERLQTNGSAGAEAPQSERLAPSSATNGPTVSQGSHEGKPPAPSEKTLPRKILPPTAVNGQQSVEAVKSESQPDAAAGSAQIPAQAHPSADQIRDAEDTHREGASDRGNESSANDAAPQAGAGSDRLDVVPVELSVPSSVDESAVGLCPPPAAPAAASDQSDSNPDNRSVPESKDPPCSTSSNQVTREDWDEFYTKTSTNLASPPNFLKILKANPHTRRYYQARTLPARRSNRTPSSASEADPPQLAGSPKASSAETGKVFKRPFTCDENNSSRENKRQHRESISGRVSSTCMAMEELCRSDVSEGVPSEEHGQGVALEKGFKDLSGETGSVKDLTAVDDVGQRAGVSDARQASDATVEDTKRESSAQGVLAQGPQAGISSDAELQNSGHEQRVGSTSTGGDTADDRQPEEPTSFGADASHSFPERGILPTCENSRNTDASTDGTSLYGDSVPRWGDVETSTTRGVDQLLIAETSSSTKQDEWDVEYDRGRSKKVRSKISRESSEGIVGGNVTGESAPKSSNPFQTFGLVKQRSALGVRKGNSIGFKAGYGYGLKTGRNNAFSGSHTTKTS